MNKKSSSKNSFILFIAAVSSAIVLSALRCVNLFLFFDRDIGYYQSGAPLPAVFNILLIALTVFFTIFSFVGAKKLRIKSRQAPKPAADIALGLLAIAALTAALASSYFNQRVQMNSPDKLLLGLACVFAMVFIANELKVSVGTGRPSTYNLFAALTTLFGSVASIPSIIAFHAKALTSSDGIYFEYYVVLAAAVFAAVRLWLAVGRGASVADRATEADTEILGSPTAGDGETDAESAEESQGDAFEK